MAQLTTKRAGLPRATKASFLAGAQRVTSGRDAALLRGGRNGKRRGGALNLQMNIFERVSRVVRSYVNAAITAAEDPEKMLEQSVSDLQNDLVKMRQASAQVMASTKQLEKRMEQAETSSQEWYKRAKLAVEKGEDELAKEALKRRKTFEDSATSLRTQLDSQRTVLQKLLNDTKTLENKVAEAKSKKDTLKARAQSAKASRALSDLTSGIDAQSSLAAFERMEEKVMTLEAEAEAAGELTGDVISSQFAALEGGDDIDAELQALKGGSKPAQALPGEVVFDDAIEAELRELKED
ncbi:PspA/IM30-like protein [Chloropicon primus]|nr:PspA/IM30-like protein [Chloropicon primus]